MKPLAILLLFASIVVAVKEPWDFTPHRLYRHLRFIQTHFDGGAPAEDTRPEFRGIASSPDPFGPPAPPAPPGPPGPPGHPGPAFPPDLPAGASRPEVNSPNSDSGVEDGIEEGETLAKAVAPDGVSDLGAAALDDNFQPGSAAIIDESGVANAVGDGEVPSIVFATDGEPREGGDTALGGGDSLDTKTLYDDLPDTDDELIDAFKSVERDSSTGIIVDGEPNFNRISPGSDSGIGATTPDGEGRPEIFATDGEPLAATEVMESATTAAEDLDRVSRPDGVLDAVSAREVAKGRSTAGGKRGVFYRGDSRSPLEVFENGFQPQGRDMSLHNHLSFSGNSGYVSVTKSPSIAAVYAFGRTGSKLAKGYVYLISSREMPGGYWIPGRFPKDPAVRGNQEFAAIGNISPESIQGAFEISRDNPGKLEEWIPNPKYQGRDTQVKCEVMKRGLRVPACVVIEDSAPGAIAPVRGQEDEGASAEASAEASAATELVFGGEPGVPLAMASGTLKGDELDANHGLKHPEGTGSAEGLHGKVTDEDLGGRVEDDEVYPSPYVRVKGDGVGANQYGRVEDAESGPDPYGRLKHAGDKPTSRESGEFGFKSLVKELADEAPYGRVRLAPSRDFGRDRSDKLRQVFDMMAWEREFFHRVPFHKRPFRPDMALGHHFGDVGQGSRSRGPTARESRLARIKTLAHMVNSNKAERQQPSADDWLLAQILTDDIVPAPADSQDLMVWMHETNPKSFATLAVAMKRGLMSTEECIMVFREAAKRVLTARRAEVLRLGASAGLWDEVLRETQGLVARRIRMADPWRVM